MNYFSCGYFRAEIKKQPVVLSRNRQVILMRLYINIYFVAAVLVLDHVPYILTFLPLTLTVL